MTRSLRFGIIRNFAIPYDELVDQVKTFEEVGFDSLWGIDHLARPSDPEGPLLEGWTGLAALATVTSRIRLGLLVTSNTFRHPALVAKEAVTVDHISHGRVEIGIGAGGFEPEHHTFGLPFPAPGERVDRLIEAVEIIDLLMRNDVTTYSGRYWQIEQAPFRPGPVQRPRPPLTIAGSGPRIVRLAARLADRWNGLGTPEATAESIRILDEHCAAIGRPPSEIIRSIYLRTATLGVDPWASERDFLDTVERYAKAGIEEFIFEPPLGDQWSTMREITGRTIPTLRRGR